MIGFNIYIFSSLDNQPLRSLHMIPFSNATMGFRVSYSKKE